MGDVCTTSQENVYIWIIQDYICAYKAFKKITLQFYIHLIDLNINNIDNTINVEYIHTQGST